MIARYVCLFWGAALSCACATPPESAGEGSDRLEQFFSGDMEIIDLTHALSSSSTSWLGPSENPFEHEILTAHESGRPKMARYSTPEHHGTHLDAPTHSADYQPTVDELTAADLFGPAAVIDVSAQCEANADYELTTEDVLAWEQEHGPLPEGAIVIMSTGWSRKYDDAAAYNNEDAEGEKHFPGFSEEVSRFLVQERSIRGIGIDTLSVDPAVAKSYPVHGIVNGAGKYHLENVAEVHRLPTTGAFLIVAPIKIAGGSGGQVRIFALVP